MKRIIVAIACVLLVVPLLFMSACNTVQAEKKDYPELYEELYSLLGEYRETVLTRLNLTEQDLVPVQAQKGLYETPLTAKYHGVTFSVWLGFVELNNKLKGRMESFRYRKLAENQWDNSIHEVSVLSKALTQTFGASEEKEDRLIFSKTSEAELSQAFIGEDAVVRGNYWLVQKRNDPAVSSYLADILEVRTNNDPIATDHLNMNLTMAVNANKQYDAVLVQLIFRLDFEPVARTGSDADLKS